MDIDAPTPTAEPGSFSLIFPLPFRILSLISLGILAWATNLHGASAIGVDTAQVLDVRIDEPDAASLLPRVHPGGDRGGSPTGARRAGLHRHPTSLYSPVYQLGLAFSASTFVGWAFFRVLTAGDPTLVRRFTLMPFFWLLAGLGLLASPHYGLYRRERWMALQSLKRTVFGDVWVSGCLVLAAEHGLASQMADISCYKEFMVPLMTSLPYIFRLRQCLAEYFGRHTPTPQRSLLNALKYATAFPVIILSALQAVYGDPFDEPPADSVTKSGANFSADSGFGIGQHALFQIWIVAVFINSLYSFWWDVTNDWGLTLLTSEGWSQKPAIRLPPSRGSSQTRKKGATKSVSGASRGSTVWSTPDAMRQHRARSQSVQLHVPGTPEIGQDPIFPPLPCSTSPPAVPRPSHHGHHHRRRKSVFNLPFTQDPPFLRPSLLLPDPLIYYLLICLDLVLRLTWSLKLSSHLHEVHELESGVYAMEALEVVRRWLWVFARIEWEAVKKGGGAAAAGSPGAEVVPLEDMGAENEGLGGGAAYEGPGLGGSAYLHVPRVEESGLKGGGGKMNLMDSDYESDSSMILVSSDKNGP